MQPAVPIKEGSPIAKNWTNSEMSGTADEQLASGMINTADRADTSVHAGPVPLFLVPQTISSEIHVRLAGQHVNTITLTRAARTGTTTGDHAGADAGSADTGNINAGNVNAGDLHAD